VQREAREYHVVWMVREYNLSPLNARMSEMTEMTSLEQYKLILFEAVV